MFRPLLSLTLWILFFLLSSRGVAQQGGPSEVVERLHQTLLEVMKNADETNYQDRYQQLAPVIRETHDLYNIARIAVGRYWQQLDENQKTLLVDTFEELSIATYADRFDSYGGETFEILSEERPDPDEALVHSLFIQADGKELRFDYMLRRSEESWRIINIIVGGVSDLALKRAEFTSILRREGFSKLINELRDKIAEYAGKTSE